MHVRVSRQVINRQGFSLMETKDRPGAFSSAQSQLSIRLDSPLTAWIASGRLKQVWSTPDLADYRKLTHSPEFKGSSVHSRCRRSVAVAAQHVL